MIEIVILALVVVLGIIAGIRAIDDEENPRDRSRDERPRDTRR